MNTEVPENMPDLEKYEGKHITTFMVTGAVLSGKAHFSGEWVNLDRDNESALCNMRHIVSITRKD